VLMLTHGDYLNARSPAVGDRASRGREGATGTIAAPPWDNAKERKVARQCLEHSAPGQPNQEVDVVQRTCEQCGAAFEAKEFFVRRGEAKYCSRPCFIESQRGRPRYSDDVRRERFWAKVDRGTIDDCWEWTGARQSSQGSAPGYGSVRLEGRQLSAHRIAWEYAHGPIPDGLVVCHHCDNPPCCNPAHLFLGTIMDNNADRTQKGRSASGDKHWTRHRPLRGEQATRAKLTAVQVAEIRRLYAEGGISQRELAERYPVSKSAIKHILKGRSWV